jgi:hypothetical protein
MAAGRGGLVATARNDLVNFGFQEPWKNFREIFQGLEKPESNLSNLWNCTRTSASKSGIPKSVGNLGVPDPPGGGATNGAVRSAPAGALHSR